MRRPLPRLVEVLVSLQVPRGSREAFLGDLEEEFARRQGREGAGGTGWLWRQALWSIPHWAAYRSARSDALKNVLSVFGGLAATALFFTLLNSDVVLEWVRSLPTSSRYPVARGLNLFAMATGGLVTGHLALTHRPELLVCMAGLGAAPGVLQLAASGAVSGPLLLWGGALAGAALLGYGAGRAASS